MSDTINNTRRILLSSYAAFCYAFQDDGWFDPVHESLCNWLQKETFEKLAQNKDVLCQVTMPRGSLKSTLVTKYFSVWMTLLFFYCEEEWFPFDKKDWKFFSKREDLRTLIATNTYTNGSKKLQDIKNLIKHNEDFLALFPEVMPRTQDAWSADRASIARLQQFPEDTFESAGVGTKKTGCHYNIEIEDDTLAPDESEMKKGMTLPSRETMDKAIGYHEAIVPLFVPKGVRISVIVTTRWGEGDIVDHVRTKEHGYIFFDVPAEDPDTGKANFSCLYNIEKLKEIERRIGPYMYSCLYKNNPVDPALKKFKLNWINRAKMDSKSIHEIDFDYVTVALDPAISERNDACESAITVVGHKQVTVTSLRGDKTVEKKHAIQYWLHCSLSHDNPFEVCKETLDLAVEYMAREIIIETVAFQESLKYTFFNLMESEYDERFPIVEFKSRQEKLSRIEGTLVPLFSRECIFLNEDLPDEVFSQLQNFPTSILIDGIDSFSFHAISAAGDRRVAKPKPVVVLDPFELAVMEIVKSKNKGCLGYINNPRNNVLANTAEHYRILRHGNN